MGVWVETMVKTQVSADFSQQVQRLRGTHRARLSAALSDLSLILVLQTDRTRVDRMAEYVLRRPMRVAALTANRSDPLLLAALAGDRAMRDIAGLKASKGVDGEDFDGVSTLEQVAVDAATAYGRLCQTDPAQARKLEAGWVANRAALRSSFLDEAMEAMESTYGVACQAACDIAEGRRPLVAPPPDWRPHEHMGSLGLPEGLRAACAHTPLVSAVPDRYQPRRVGQSHRGWDRARVRFVARGGIGRAEQLARRSVVRTSSVAQAWMAYRMRVNISRGPEAASQFFMRVASNPRRAATLLKLRADPMVVAATISPVAMRAVVLGQPVPQKTQVARLCDALVRSDRQRLQAERRAAGPDGQLKPALQDPHLGDWAWAFVEKAWRGPQPPDGTPQPAVPRNDGFYSTWQRARVGAITPADFPAHLRWGTDPATSASYVDRPATDPLHVPVPGSLDAEAAAKLPVDAPPGSELADPADVPVAAGQETETAPSVQPDSAAVSLGAAAAGAAAARAASAAVAPDVPAPSVPPDSAAASLEAAAARAAAARAASAAVAPDVVVSAMPDAPAPSSLPVADAPAAPAASAAPAVPAPPAVPAAPAPDASPPDASAPDASAPSSVPVAAEPVAPAALAADASRADAPAPTAAPADDGSASPAAPAADASVPPAVPGAPAPSSPDSGSSSSHGLVVYVPLSEVREPSPPTPDEPPVVLRPLGKGRWAVVDHPTLDIVEETPGGYNVHFRPAAEPSRPAATDCANRTHVAALDQDVADRADARFEKKAAVANNLADGMADQLLAGRAPADEVRELGGQSAPHLVRLVEDGPDGVRSGVQSIDGPSGLALRAWMREQEPEVYGPEFATRADIEAAGGRLVKEAKGVEVVCPVQREVQPFRPDGAVDFDAPPVRIRASQPETVYHVDSQVHRSTSQVRAKFRRPDLRNPAADLKPPDLLQLAATTPATVVRDPQAPVGYRGRDNSINVHRPSGKDGPMPVADYNGRVIHAAVVANVRHARDIDGTERQQLTSYMAAERVASSLAVPYRPVELSASKRRAAAELCRTPGVVRGVARDADGVAARVLDAGHSRSRARAERDAPGPAPVVAPAVPRHLPVRRAPRVPAPVSSAQQEVR